MWEIYLLGFLLLIIVTILWVRGINNMHKKYPKYKGEDFFNKDEEEDLKK
jgi:hypothetical protein